MRNRFGRRNYLVSSQDSQDTCSAPPKKKQPNIIMIKEIPSRAGVPNLFENEGYFLGTD